MLWFCCLAIDVWMMFKMTLSFLLSLLLKTNWCLNDVCMMSKSCLNEFLMIYEDVWLCHHKLFILSKMMSEWCVNDVLIMFGWCSWSTIFESVKMRSEKCLNDSLLIFLWFCWLCLNSKMNFFVTAETHFFGCPEWSWLVILAYRSKGTHQHCKQSNLH